MVGAIIDTVVYLATEENASLGGLVTSVARGAVESAVNPLAKLNKVSKLATAATKVYSRISKATRVKKIRGFGRASSCSLHSFTVETLVTLADGSQVPISAVRVGDTVLAWDEASDSVGSYPVTAVWVHDDPVTGIVVIDAGSASHKEHRTRVVRRCRL